MNSYISGSTVQRVQGADVKNYSKFLANLLLGQQFYEIKRTKENFLALLSSDDCEDLVALYMQIKFGFVVIPSSCKSDTAVYEYVMKHRETGRKAVAQVKQGAVNLDLNKYVGIDADIFLFTSGGSYIGANKPNIFCLKSDELVSFANENYHLMSDRIQHWIDLERKLHA